MTIKTFVAKVSRIVNNKEKNYVIYRMNVPSNVVDELELAEDDYLLVNARKAKWFHLLTWTGGRMTRTWARLPDEIRREIRRSGLLEEEAMPSPMRATSNQFLTISERQNRVPPYLAYVSVYLSTLANAPVMPTNERLAATVPVSAASRR